MVDTNSPPRPPFLDGTIKRMLIGAHWVEAASGRTFDSINPSTGEVVATIAEGDGIDIDRAVRAAREAFEGPWRKTKPFERQALLLKLSDLVERHFEELVTLDSLEMGAPITRASRNRRVIGELRYYAGLATVVHGETAEVSLPGDHFAYTAKEPLGVIGAIIPWNGPLSSAVWKIGPVLAAGCTLVLKPAEQASLSSLRMAELCLEAGVPPGVINVVPGFGETAGATLAAHMGVDKVAFTGSHRTGQRIVQASAGNLKRLLLELGGKSPHVVFADADLDAAAPVVALSIFGNSGQICAAGSRLFVERDIYPEFTARVAEFGRSLRIGNSSDPATEIGPLVSAEQLDRVTGYMEIGREEGAKALSGGARITEGELAKGFFVPPTVFAEVHDEMRIAREEIFGPVVSAMAFDDLNEVIGRANASSFGLASGLWTRDLGRAHQFASRIQAGSVWINTYGAVDPALPFGGYKMSGYGREGGRHHLDELLTTKSVCIKIG